VISPHPDDESIGCGGAIRDHVVKGASVRVVFLTSGEQGGHGRPPEETIRIREMEAAGDLRAP
jgi:LmbE family N-acetylglucosaminyl deacetylase